MLSQYSSVPAAGVGRARGVDVFVAGQFGELTRYVPFDLVDAVVAEGVRVRRRLWLVLLASVLPPRRARLSARKVKCVQSRYAGRSLEERPTASTRVTGLDIRLRWPGTAPSPVPSPTARAKIMTPGSRVDRVFALLRAEPDRAMTPSELARELGITKVNSFSVQLATWARRGLLGKTGRGCYTIP